MNATFYGFVVRMGGDEVVSKKLYLLVTPGLLLDFIKDLSEFKE